MRLVLAAALCTLSAPVLAAPLHSYAGLVLSPKGDRVAAVESTPGGKHAAITIRSAKDGRVMRAIDPCATCSYSGLSFAATMAA